jgi:hypothetical protein
VSGRIASDGRGNSITWRIHTSYSIHQITAVCDCGSLCSARSARPPNSTAPWWVEHHASHCHLRRVYYNDYNNGADRPWNRYEYSAAEVRRRFWLSAPQLIEPARLCIEFDTPST